MENRSKRGSVALPILYNRLVLSRTCKPHPGLRSWGGVPEWVKFPPESSGLGFRGAEFEPKLYHLRTCALGQNHPTCLNFRLSACKIRIIFLCKSAEEDDRRDHGCGKTLQTADCGWEVEARKGGAGDWKRKRVGDEWQWHWGGCWAPQWEGSEGGSWMSLIQHNNSLFTGLCRECSHIAYI